MLHIIFGGIISYLIYYNRCSITFIFIFLLQGAQTVLHCAIEPSLSNESGNIYRDCKLYVSKKKLDPDVALHLWDVSAKLTKINESLN